MDVQHGIYDSLPPVPVLSHPYTKIVKIIKIKTKECEEVELFNPYKIITNFCQIMERSLIGFFNIFQNYATLTVTSSL
jgi:hypothetical protein